MECDFILSCNQNFYYTKQMTQEIVLSLEYMRMYMKYSIPFFLLEKQYSSKVKTLLLKPFKCKQYQRQRFVKVYEHTQNKITNDFTNTKQNPNKCKKINTKPTSSSITGKSNRS